MGKGMGEGELKTLGRYTIERTLGKGAMGVVYEGLDPKLNRRVAIKTILKSHLDPDTAKDYSLRFSREAQAVARLNHPHIVQVYDFAEEGDIAYLVMEFIRGKELKAFFDAAERFDIGEAVRIMCELLDALEFAHNAGVVHRDIKPANVMLDAQARTKLTDFGVARVQDVDRTHAERTQAGTMVGTPAYMSPEQITGRHVDKRTDVFSAGIILYQFLTGEKPFTGGGAWTIAKKIIQEDPALPSSLNSAVTPLIDAVVNKALAKSPEMRYQSAKEFAVALRRALEGKGEAEDADKTVAGEIGIPSGLRPVPQPRPAAAAGGSGMQTGPTEAGNQEIELEFWRAIKDGTDPDDFELYVQQFPNGIYAALAKRKIAKLRGAAPDDTSAEAKKEAEEAARREAEARAKLAEEKARLEQELAKREEELKAQAAAGARETSPAVLVGVPVLIIAIAGAAWYYLAPDDTAQREKIAAMQRQLEAAKRQAEAAERAKKNAEEARVALEKARRTEEEARKSGDAAKARAAAEASARAEAEAKKTADAAKAAHAKAASAEAREKAEAEKAIADAKAAAEKAKAEAQKAIADAKAAEAKAKAEAEKARTAAVSGTDTLFAQASALEQQGKGVDAVKAYTRAARAGHSKAMKRLGEIYDKGIPGVSRDYAESLKWYNAARVLGEDVPLAKSR
jgi:serine/threonine-protein kinase